MKLDGDIELPPSYLRVLTERFDADRRLGLAGGVLVEPSPGGEPHRLLIPRHHVHGAVKCYSRECFAAIGGVQARLGWDTIDETYAPHARLYHRELRGSGLHPPSAMGHRGRCAARVARDWASAPTSRNTRRAG